MADYVISFRVPADYKPTAETPDQWKAWFGGLGENLVDVGRAVNEYASADEVGGGRPHSVAYAAPTPKCSGTCTAASRPWTPAPAAPRCSTGSPAPRRWPMSRSGRPVRRPAI